LYRALWQYAEGARGTLLAAMALLLGAQLVVLGIPYAAGRALNILQLRGFAGLGEAATWLGAILGLTLASWMLHGPGRLLERNVSLQLRQKLSGALVERLVQLPLSWHESQHSGATTHRVQQSVNALAGFAESQYVYLSSLVRLVGPVVALTLLQPWVGMAALAGLAAIALATTSADRRMMALAHVENDAERRYASTLLDSLGNVTTLFALRQARAVVKLMQQRLQEVFEPLKRSIVINEVKWFTVEMSSRALSCALVALFAWLASRSPTTGAAGQAVMLGSLYMVWEYAQQAGGVVTAIASHFQAFARLQADYSSADVIRDAPVARHLAPGDGHVETWKSLSLAGLHFRHPASREAAAGLADVSLTFESGKRYALIGPSGSGKSTLLRILSGLYVAEAGQLDIDGTRTTDVETAARTLRLASTLVPQDAEVYEGTLAENLGLCESLEGLPESGDFPRALSIAQTDGFIATTQEGLACRIVERGANWSGGQRARIALARGILAAKGSPLMLLDEPTASLDAVTEAAVYDALFDAFPASCIVSSVHRLHLLPRFDEVILMQAGRVVAQGAVTTLQRESAEFRGLVAAYERE